MARWIVKGKKSAVFQLLNINSSMKYLKITLISLFFFLTLAGNVLAFTDNYNKFLNEAGTAGTYQTEIQGQNTFLDTFLGNLIATILGFVGVFFLGLTIYSGFQWMTAGGNEEKVTKARTRVINGIIGLAITVLAFILTNALFNYFSQRFLGPEEVALAQGIIKE